METLVISAGLQIILFSLIARINWGKGGGDIGMVAMYLYIALPISLTGAYFFAQERPFLTTVLPGTLIGLLINYFIYRALLRRYARSKKL